MEKLELESKVEKEEKPKAKPKAKPKPKKVDWAAWVDKRKPDWNLKFKRAAIAYLSENNPKSVTLTDKPTTNTKSTVVVGGKVGIRDFVASLEEEGYKVVKLSKFSGVGVFAVLENEKK